MIVSLPLCNLGDQGLSHKAGLSACTCIATCMDPLEIYIGGRLMHSFYYVAIKLSNLEYTCHSEM